MAGVDFWSEVGPHSEQVDLMVEPSQVSKVKPYGSVSAGREKSLFRVTFFVYGEPSCGQTMQNRIDFSIDFG